MGKLIVLLPLFVAFLLVAGYFAKLLKQRPWSASDKQEALASVRALVYVFGAAILVWWLVPSTLDRTGAVIGTILSSILAILIVLSVLELPARMSRADSFLWRDGWTTPVYSRSKRPVPYVRWGRRFALLAFGLFALLVAIVAALSGPTLPATATDGAVQPVVTTPGTASPATPSVPNSTPKTSPTTSKAPSTIVNNCGGPTPVVVDTPTFISFGTGNLKICHNGQWLAWSQFQPSDVAPPRTVKLTAWAQDATYGYGAVTVADVNSPFNGVSYLIQTTDFK